MLDSLYDFYQQHREGIGWTATISASLGFYLVFELAINSGSAFLSYLDDKRSYLKNKQLSLFDDGKPSLKRRLTEHFWKE